VIMSTKKEYKVILKNIEKAHTFIKI
jgi:hypothetical protein